MPVLTYKQFEERTSVTMTARGTALKLIGERLKQYNKAPGEQTLASLWWALDQWQTGHSLDPQDRESWVNDRRNKKGAIEELSNWVKRKMNEDAILAFQRAAIHIVKIYGPALDDQYRTSLMDIFVNNEVDSTQPMTSLIHWKTEGKWQNRLVQMGWTAAQGTSNGLTSPWDGPMLAATSRGVFAATRGNTPPLNRIVEVATLEHHTLCHELLHWLTHESFRARFANMRDANLRKYIIEGLTEFLTRKGLDEWDQGGYTDLVPLWREMMSANNVIQFSQMANAYFKGRDLDEFEGTITEFTRTNKEYQKTQKAAFLTALAGWNH